MESFFEFGFGFGSQLTALGGAVFFGFAVEFGSHLFLGFLNGFADFEQFIFAFAMDAVHGFDDEEEDPGDDEELEHGLEEFAVGNGGGVVGAEEVGDADGEVVEVDTTGD